ncbi:potassium channel beta subunit family protein [Natronogracilivirga saccharolytica]|uniref:Aldo/keto reductase n=1 Tax=Natronogracilivirga saccharolytica TaxID=2812953 RepID=A0A8J7UVD2_9BACT|nr:aldo/keto reductase [Natronogracilivirga saccharolytica]MBP3193325.1 aldo/keto reductase [Natronogracilivirga saccharolytica]
MIYRRLGKAGVQVSALSFGSWLTFGKLIDDATAEKLMHIAYDNGINFFDNAEGYYFGKSEEVMGDILKKSGWDRTTYLVSSKVFWGGKKPNQTGLSKKHVFEACHAALRRLQVDYLDLFFCHRPDKNTPMEETVWAMHQLVMQGKVLYWGTSEWSAQEIMEAHAVAKQHNLVAPVMEQPQYNMIHRERVEVEYKKLYRPDVAGMGTTIWSPLASGLLTGKYNKGIPEEQTRLKEENLDWLKEAILTSENIEKANKLTGLADELDMSLARLAVAWCLKNPDVSTVILGASKEHQLEENLKAVEDIDKLDDAAMDRIEEILQNKPEQPMF